MYKSYQGVLNDLQMARLPRSRMIWLPPPSPRQLARLAHTGRQRKIDNLLGGEGEDGGLGAESCDSEKSW